MFIKNRAVTGFPFSLITPAGAAVTSGTVTGYITKDGGVQATMSGTAVHEGQGQWSINITADEMNADAVGLIFVHASAIPASFSISTTARAETIAGSTWSTTALGIKRNIEHLYRRLTGTSQITYTDAKIIGEAVNEAMMQVCTERGDSRWSFRREEISVTCTASQTYVELPESTIQVIEGTVRIPSKNSMLYPTSLEAIVASDPEQSLTGVPVLYAFNSTSDAATPRLELTAIPDDAYVIYMYVEKVIDSGDIASFPGWMHGMITDLATAIAMRRLGFGNSAEYMMAYQEAMLNISNKTGGDGPRHINRGTVVYTRDIQRRTP